MPDDGGPKTLRDEFAMAALPMSAVLTSIAEFASLAADEKAETLLTPEGVAHGAYKLADAMLAERTKLPDHDSPLWKEQTKE